MIAEPLRIALNAAGGVLVCATAPGSFELALLTLGGLLPARRRPDGIEALPRTAVIIPPAQTGIGRA